MTQAAKKMLNSAMMEFNEAVRQAGRQLMPHKSSTRIVNLWIKIIYMKKKASSYDNISGTNPRSEDVIDSFQRTLDNSTIQTSPTSEDERRLNSDSNNQKHTRRAGALYQINDAGLRFQSTRGLHSHKAGGRYYAPERRLTS